MSAATPNPVKPSRSSGGLEVPRGGGKCAVSGRVIAPRETYFAAVRETPNGIERLDISADCWPRFDKSVALAFWRTVMPDANEKAQALRR